MKSFLQFQGFKTDSQNKTRQDGPPQYNAVFNNGQVKCFVTLMQLKNEDISSSEANI